MLAERGKCAVIALLLHALAYPEMEALISVLEVHRALRVLHRMEA